MEKKCISCQKIIEGKHASVRKYCNKKCRNEKLRKDFKSANKYYNIPNTKVGAMNELVVSVDLMGKGFDVFRCLAPAASCDLAIVYKKKLYLVEVTTGYFSTSGKVLTAKKEKENFDILAIVIGEGKIIYRYEIQELKHIINFE